MVAAITLAPDILDAPLLSEFGEATLNGAQRNPGLGAERQRLSRPGHPFHDHLTPITRQNVFEMTLVFRCFIKEKACLIWGAKIVILFIHEASKRPESLTRRRFNPSHRPKFATNHNMFTINNLHNPRKTILKHKTCHILDVSEHISAVRDIKVLRKIVSLPSENVF